MVEGQIYRCRAVACNGFKQKNGSVAKLDNNSFPLEPRRLLLFLFAPTTDFQRCS